MSPIFETLGIEQLSTADRLLLVEEIWDSIAAEVANQEVPPAHQAEIQRRIAEDDANPDAALPWSDVKARLLNEDKAQLAPANRSK